LRFFLQNFPISFFSKVLGLLGFALAAKKGIHVLGWPSWFGILSQGLAFLVFFLVLSLYVMKGMFFSRNVFEEFAHPVKKNFFPLVSICFLLSSVLIGMSHPLLSFYFWMFGTALHLSFTFLVISSWLYHPHFEINHMNPSWFIPCVGTILIPIMGVEFGYLELSWFAFSVGFFSWLMLFTIVFYRLIFHHPLMEKLVPTTFILMAPPAVAAMSYAKLTSLAEVDVVMRVLYYFSLFLLFLLVSHVRRFYCIRFYLSWWAYSFPLSAVISATLLMFEKTGKVEFAYFADGLFGILVCLITWLLYRTTRGLLEKDFVSVLMVEEA